MTLLDFQTSFTAMTGAFVGLNYFMRFFAPCPINERRACQQIYACVKKLSDPPDEYKDLTLFRGKFVVSLSLGYFVCNSSGHSS